MGYLYKLYSRYYLICKIKKLKFYFNILLSTRTLAFRILQVYIMFYEINSTAFNNFFFFLVDEVN